MSDLETQSQQRELSPSELVLYTSSDALRLWYYLLLRSKEMVNNRHYRSVKDRRKLSFGINNDAFLWEVKYYTTETLLKLCL
jgi:hypothetical protein